MASDSSEPNIRAAGPRSNAAPAFDASSSAPFAPFADPPALTLPKGGGAIRGIGEKLSVNAATGSCALSIPVFTSPGRGGFGPQLSLSYDSGAGNGPFGLGMSLSVPAIARKTEKALPRYQDADDPDVFVLSGAEDLVPCLTPGGAPRPPESIDGFQVRRYRPRIEGLFSRVERWTDDSGDSHWRSVSRDNVTTIYGRSAAARIADPADPTRVWKWLIEETADDKGNLIAYEYKREDFDGVGVAAPCEANRAAIGGPCGHRYLKRIFYGNQTPFAIGGWHFQVVLDYGEHDADNPIADGEVRVWPARLDPFSSYRPGFEVRLYRLCRRVLMFHQFDALGAGFRLVRSTDFEYAESPVATVLKTASQTGYVRRGAEAAYRTRSLPRLELDYAAARIDREVKSVDRDSLENLPAGLDPRRSQWIDLDGEGLSGILTEQADAWYYKRNVGDGRFGPLERIGEKPTPSLAAGAQLMDLANDGAKSVVQLDPQMSGFFGRQSEGGWDPFVAFESKPNVDFRSPEVKLVDLDGDGLPDVLVSEDEVFTWYQSLGRDGFGPGRRVNKPLDARGPACVFSDATESIYLADMSGDGLTDIARIRNGEICYWPNLGYGRFGAKVTMANAPAFDHPDQFRQDRIHLADVDGSGPTDIIYVGPDEVRTWANLSGNGWSSATLVTSLLRTDDLASIAAVDLLGNGTTCLVWSSALVSEAGAMRYIDLMGGTKPHLLQAFRNNMGAETRIAYAPSTRFYRRDVEAGRPWVTRLPFPVHLTERVETCDFVTGNRFVTTYRYSHGHYDGVEQEFRGFGYVEQIDTDEFGAFQTGGLFPPGTNTLDADLHTPPVVTKTWFHTGAFIGGDTISAHLAGEYYALDTHVQAALLADTRLPEGLPSSELVEACRALRGQVLRQEVYGLDGGPLEAHPYTVSERTYHIHRVQPRGPNRHAVFFTSPAETVDFRYERRHAPHDPRVTHQLTLAVDEFGSVTRSAAVAYPRRNQPAFVEQSRLAVTYAENDVVNEDVVASYRVGVPIEARTYELALAPPAAGARFAFDELAGAAAAVAAVPYEAAASIGHKRLIENVRQRYYLDDLSGVAPLGVAGLRALPYHALKLAFTPAMVTTRFGGRVDDTMLADLGKYVLDGDGWWIPSGRAIYDAARFYLPVAFTTPFLEPLGLQLDVEYDPSALLVVRTTDPAGNQAVADNDYRTLGPSEITDANGNVSRVAVDALGMVVGSALAGKPLEAAGDTLDGFDADLTEAELAAHVADPLVNPHAILAGATSRLVYDLHAWTRPGPDGQPGHNPVAVYTLARETHVADLAAGEETQIQHRFLYSDGFGREVQSVVQAEPGPAPVIDPATGHIVRDGGGQPVLDATMHRWVGSGRTVFNNKGKPVKQYEPFFSASHRFERAEELVSRGVTPIFRYDSAGRLVRTDLPDGTFSQIVFDSWRQESWDGNDTVLQSAWYVAHGQPDPNGPAPVADAARAAWLAAKHAGTPAVAHVDPQGRTFRNEADNGGGQIFATVITLDIEGNALAITDARGHVVTKTEYDMVGRTMNQTSIDAGPRWSLPDAAGAPCLLWDARDHRLRREYDPLRRPQRLFVRSGIAAETLAEQIVYGESLGDAAAALNVRNKPYLQYDGAGVVTNRRYDFKGNLIEGSRQFLALESTPPDWTQSPAVDEETFASATRYDALNRAIQAIAPHREGTGLSLDVIQPTYNVANLLERIDVWQGVDHLPTALLDPAGAAFSPVVAVEYDAKGQRTQIGYGNGVTTQYRYDAQTFRLANLTTIRPATELQNLSYVYDPVGNVTHIQDDGDLQNSVYFKNQRVDPSADYEYDAVYRLTRARGREHLGLTGNTQLPPRQNTEDEGFWTSLPLPGDGNAVGRYVESYSYDAVGNLLAIAHPSGGNGWTRQYQYDEPGFIDASQTGNRLSRTSLPNDPPGGPFTGAYAHDAHGNLSKMPHLSEMTWDFKDQLQSVNLGGGGTARYIYDAAGQRIRKVWDKTATLREERMYFSGWELFRRRIGGEVVLERASLHLLDGTRRIAIVETKTIDLSGSPEPPRTVRYQFGNHLGSAALELDAQADVISYEEYFPFGSTSFQAGRSAIEVSRKRYRYVGREHDEETGFYYLSARYYIPWLGRWTRCDPSGIHESVNLYVYGQNRPTALIDLTGHAPQPPPDTDYFNDVVPHIVSVLRKKSIGLDKTLFLVLQAYSEQGPSLGLPSQHHNRIFNHHGTELDLKEQFGGDAAQKKAALERNEVLEFGDGIHLQNLPQNESPDVTKPDIKTSPTYFYDNLDASVAHHLQLLEKRFGSAFKILKTPGGRLEDYARALRGYGHLIKDEFKKEREAKEQAGEPIKEERLMHYDEVLLQKRLAQVSTRLKAWAKFRVKELAAEIASDESYIKKLNEDLDENYRLQDEYHEQFQKTGEKGQELMDLQAERRTLAQELASAKQRLQELKDTKAGITEILKSIK